MGGHPPINFYDLPEVKLNHSIVSGCSPVCADNDHEGHNSMEELAAARDTIVRQNESLLKVRGEAERLRAENHRMQAALASSALDRGAAGSPRQTRTGWRRWLLGGAESTPTAAERALSAPRCITHDADKVAEAAVDMMLWRDDVKYLEGFLPLFGLPFATISESLERKDAHVAMRHDIDRSVENALVGATLENQLGIRSTYFLLHPDGIVSASNYFGAIENRRLVIHESLFEWAKRLSDLGHEVALHNDLISLALATRRQPEEFLEEILEQFSRRKLKIAGTVAHGGTPLNRELGYLNYQMFADFRDEPVFVEYRTESNAASMFGSPTVELEGHRIEKYRVKLSDFGLKYEANFVPWEIFVRDNNGRWFVSQGEEDLIFNESNSASEMPRALTNALRRKEARTAVQCVVHFCHWNVVSQLRPRLCKAARRERDRRFAERRKEPMRERLAKLENVIGQPDGDDRFADYDRKYAATPQLYRVVPGVKAFIHTLMRHRSSPVRSILEAGCGQGDLIATVHREAEHLFPGAMPRALGVDGSLSAILVSAGRYPQVEWMVKELERLLSKHDALVPPLKDGQPRRNDLVLDKTGTIFLHTYEAARAYFAAIVDLMEPNGLYVYIATRKYYRQCLEGMYAGWPKHWIALAEEFMEPLMPADDDLPDNRGYLKRAFRRRA